ncbi:MAG: DUF2905 domain-containing protein [Chloroflexota bacterium]|jgi:hypothetical protein
MDDLEPLGRALVVIGLFITVLGAIMLLTPRVPWLGRLPGDIVIHRDDLTIYIPITTMLIVSVVLSVVLNLIGRGR